MKKNTLPETSRSHKTAFRLFEVATAVGSVIGGGAAMEATASAAPTLQHQEWDTARVIEHGPARTILVDENNTYGPGTTIYKYPSIGRGKKYVAETLGPNTSILISGVAAAVNPDSGNSAMMQAITVTENSGTDLNPGVYWVKYGGTKSIEKGTDPGNQTLHRDNAYIPGLAMNGLRILATYDKAHEHTIENQHQINGNQVLVGEVEFMSTGN